MSSPPRHEDTKSDSTPPFVRPPERPGLKQWKCKTCYFLVEAESLPFRCPRCGASRVKMEEAKPAPRAAEAES